MAAIPERIRIHRADRQLEIQWAGQRGRLFPFKFLRCECPCASCVNEFTGERILNPEAVPTDVTPASLEYAGNYALKIHWSDGHTTGLYSWDHFDRLQHDPQVALAPAAT